MYMVNKLISFAIISTYLFKSTSYHAPVLLCTKFVMLIADAHSYHNIIPSSANWLAVCDVHTLSHTSYKQKQFYEP